MKQESGLSDMSNEDQRVLRLELDIDERMLDLWREASLVGAWDLETASAFMRAAYGKGYCDALQEIPEERATLVTDHGYTVPTPKPLPVDPI